MPTCIRFAAVLIMFAVSALSPRHLLGDDRAAVEPFEHMREMDDVRPQRHPMVPHEHVRRAYRRIAPVVPSRRRRQRRIAAQTSAPGCA